MGSIRDLKEQLLSAEELGAEAVQLRDEWVDLDFLPF
jgi:hypothetical protein